MRVAVLVFLVSAGLLIAVFGGQVGRGQVLAQRPPDQHSVAFGSSVQLIALTSDLGQSHQQVTLIDPKSRVMSVYHIDAATGEIALKSVRNVQWDLLMEDFNGRTPLPREIRSSLEQR